jgi:tRNA-specific 2-thiouridylase
MSGGVDSAVAAVLAGTRAVAVTLELWADPDNDGERSCCSAQAVRGARALAHRLGLPHLSLDLRAEFRAGVVEPWLSAHAAGLTPNPCVRCNGSVRLDAMLELAERLGADGLATGHYARTSDGLLRVAADAHKDQSYMLAALAPATLRRMRFPLGELHKPAVRELARRAGLAVASKPDSQDLCFLAGTGREAFLARHGALGERPGDLLDTRGRRVGEHRGVHRYTVGQRRGLGIGGGTPLYVLSTDADANTVTLGPRSELATHTVALRDAVLHRPRFDRVRLRYRQRPLACTALRSDGQLTLALAAPAYGVAPGQLACLMDGEVIVGHATIAAAAAPARPARPPERSPLGQLR